MRSLFLAAFLAASTAGTSLHAQQQPSSVIQPGARVRVAAPVRANGLIVTATRGWTVGTVQSVDREAVVLRVHRPEGETEEQIPFDVITDIEVSHGVGTPREGMRRGAIRGGGVGGAVALVPLGFVLLATGKEGYNNDGDCTGACTALEPTVGNAIRNTAIGGLAGALIGRMIGKRARELWVPVRVPSVDFRPGPSTQTVSLSIPL